MTRIQRALKASFTGFGCSTSSTPVMTREKLPGLPLLNCRPGAGQDRAHIRAIGHRAANGNGVSKFAGPTLAPEMKELTSLPMTGNPTA